MSAEVLSSTKTKVSGKVDPKAELPDAYKQTEIKALKFIFPDLKGQSVSLNHAKFLGKPVVVQIFGSWCPNCMDEMNFLIPWYLKNSKRGVEIVALAFERSLSFEEATRQLIKVQKKMNVPYVILQAGSTSEDKPAEKLDGIKNFISFPTTIFLDKNHNVLKVHAGFSGPSTGEYFEKWKTDFNQTIDGLLESK
jgi:thiol-disulfide isomerase/thioredoxin